MAVINEYEYKTKVEEIPSLLLLDSNDQTKLIKSLIETTFLSNKDNDSPFYKNRELSDRLELALYKYAGSNDILMPVL